MPWDPEHPFTYIVDISKWWEVDEDSSAASPQYRGFVDKKGNWMIEREESALGISTYRYAAGTSGYTVAWAGRAGLTYKYPYEVF
jgi:hypothetical protein